MGLVRGDPRDELYQTIADLRRRLRALETQTFPSMTPYVPTWTATVSNPVLGNGTAEGEYNFLGEMVLGWWKIEAGSTTTFGSGNYEFGLPVSRSGAGMGVFDSTFGTGRYRDQNGGRFSGFLVGGIAADVCRIVLPSATTSGGEVTVTGSAPVAAGDGDEWRGAFFFKGA